MNDELFTVPETLSPRLQWMREHGVKTFQASDGAVFSEEWWAWTGDDTAMQVARKQRPDHFFANAKTEDEAIVRHAQRRGLRLWNEPTSQPLPSCDGADNGTPAQVHPRQACPEDEGRVTSQTP